MVSQERDSNEASGKWWYANIHERHPDHAQSYHHDSCPSTTTIRTIWGILILV